MGMVQYLWGHLCWCPPGYLGSDHIFMHTNLSMLGLFTVQSIGHSGFADGRGRVEFRE